MVHRKYYRKTYKKSGKKRILGLFLRVFCLCFLLLIFCGLAVFIYYSKDLPRPEKFTEKQLVQPTKIYDREGKVLLYEIYGEEKRIIVPIEKVPDYLKLAIVATEDADFYKHFGLDFKGILRAIVLNLKLKKPIYGGSTISQQLIRSSFLTLEKTPKRKISEIVLTLELERRYSKEQILEWYLNQIPFGSNCYGVEAASQTYFKKTVSDLSLSESAILASLIKTPSYLSPYGEHKDELLKRKDYVLERMKDCGYISNEEVAKAKNAPVEFAEKTTSAIKAPHFALYIKGQLEQEYGEESLKEKGLKVYTSLNWELQEIAEAIIEERAEVNRKYNGFNASLVAVDPKTGEILAMVGSIDYFGQSWPEGCTPGQNCLFEPEVNAAIYGKGRQPGSAFKPFVYAQAFKKGFTPETVVWDVMTNFGVQGAKPYIPANYDGKFRGPVSLRQGLAQSLNIPSIKVLYLANLEDTIALARSFGITTLDKKPSFYGLSLVLGGGEVKLLDLTSAYGVFANRGLKIPPVSILKIEDLEGNIIKENKKTAQRVLESQVADLINDILSDNQSRTPVFGPRSSLYLENYSVAAKSGTTQEFRDGWVVGYTPSLAVGVWVGNNNNVPMAKEPGVVLAGPIWHNFMEKALSYFPKESFNKPNLISVEKPILKGEIDLEEPHSILHYVDKNNPQGEIPQNPESNPQYKSWETGIENWLKIHPDFIPELKKQKQENL